MLLPFRQSKKLNSANNNPIVFAGDVGATKTNLALYKVENEQLRLLHQAKLISGDFGSVAALADHFMKELPSPNAVCFGVAGPVLNGKAKLSNLSWEVDARELSQHFGVHDTHLINDLEATAYGLAVLGKEDVSVVHEGSAAPAGNAAVIAPGTGLGEAGLYWDGEYYRPFATEGGHSDFAPRDAFDFELYCFLQEQFGHVSWERVVSGQGIVNIYQFLRDVKKMEVPGWLFRKMQDADVPEMISKHVNESDICTETMRCFIQYLAYESANMILKLNATGGLFIGGGIVPKNLSLFQNKAFHNSFFKSGRLNYLLEQAPVNIILNTKAALQGAAYYAITH